MKARQGSRGWTRCRGSVVVLLALFFLPVLVAFMAASVDVGYFYAEKSRIQAVADMAVLSSLGSVDFENSGAATEKNEIRTRIQKVLTANGYKVDSLGDLNDTNILDFTTEGDNVTSVEIKAKAQIKTFFLNLLDSSKPNIDIAIQTKAEVEYMIHSMPGVFQIDGMGMVGLDGIELQGNFGANSYNSDTDGMTPGSTKVKGKDVLNSSEKGKCGVATGGNVAVSGGSGTVSGEVYAPGTIGLDGDQVTNGEGTTSEDLVEDGGADASLIHESWDGWPGDDVFPIPGEPSSNNNEEGIQVNGSYTDFYQETEGGGFTELQGSGQDVITLDQGGTYVFDGMTLNGQSTLTVNPVAGANEFTTVYVSGNTTINGGFSGGNKIRLVGVGQGDHKIKLNGNSEFYADIYAPGWDIDLGGTGDCFGRVIGKTIDKHGTPAFNRDVTIDEIFFENTEGGYPQVKVKVHLVTN